MYYENDNIKLINGDCLNIMDNLIRQDIKFNAIITDIPYGTTACEWDTIIPIEQMWEKIYKLSYNNTPFVTFASEPFASLLRYSNLKKYKYDYIWDKEQGTNQFLKDKQPLRKHENILVFYKEQCTFNKVEIHSWRREIKFRQETNNRIVGYESKEKTSYDNQGLKHPVSILPFNRPHWREGRYHDTQKPLDLMMYLVETYTNENDNILDFTCGSGTTLLAAKKLNRKATGIELTKEYCKVAKQRLTN